MFEYKVLTQRDKVFSGAFDAPALEKALNDHGADGWRLAEGFMVASLWKSAKTDRKRTTAAAKLLHVLGLAGADLEMTDRQIADALGASLEGSLGDMLAFCRNTGKKAGRGEDDGALLMEAIVRGGAPGTILLMRTGEVPREALA